MPSFLSSERLTLTIPAAATVSNPIDGKAIGDCAAIHLYGPAALDVGTYVIQISPDYNRDAYATEALAVAAATWVAWQLGDTAPADVAPPAASKGRTYFELPGVGAFRISGPAAAVDRIFTMTRLILVDK